MEPSQTRTNAFRVLALDGGGIKGTYTAAVLAELESMSGKPLSRYFDLIIGTSTGGIIAIAMGLGVAPKDILKLYVDRGPDIFREGLWRKVRHWLSPKHSRSMLQCAVETVFGDRLFGESACRLVIPAFNAQRGGVQLFKTAHAEDYKQDHKRRATEIALSTAAAPTYFSAYTAPDGACYLDGGVWANCPALVGIVEALGKLQVPLEHIRVLSIGTTTEPYSLGRRARRGGKLVWAPNVASLFMQAQVQATLGKCTLLLGPRFIRVDTTVAPGRFALDRARDVHELRALGVESARVREKAVAESFLFEEALPFMASSS